jgi:hypothetical protein
MAIYEGKWSVSLPGLSIFREAGCFQRLPGRCGEPGIELHFLGHSRLYLLCCPGFYNVNRWRNISELRLIWTLMNTINVYYNSYQASRIQCYVLWKENQLVRAGHGVSVGGFMIIIFLQLMCLLLMGKENFDCWNNLCILLTLTHTLKQYMQSATVANVHDV